MEDQGFLDPGSEIDLFCLHSVYKDRINATLKSFTDGWNNHAITTENNMSPTLLFTCGYLFFEDTAHSESVVPDSGASDAADLVRKYQIQPRKNSALTISWLPLWCP